MSGRLKQHNILGTIEVIELVLIVFTYITELRKIWKKLLTYSKYYKSYNVMRLSVKKLKYFCNGVPLCDFNYTYKKPTMNSTYFK